MRQTLIAMLTVTALVPLGLYAQKESSAVDRLNGTTDVLQDMLNTSSDRSIPQELINKAQCVVIVPNMKKAGFIFGAKYGRGYAVCRRAGGVGWTAPAGMRIEGGSFGLQIGASDSDVVLLVMNRTGMNTLLSDKFTLGVNASAVAGPVGRGSSAMTDAQLHAEILTYSRAKGIYGGLTLQGATLRPDHDADRELYGRDVTNREILAGDFHPPAAAAKLEAVLDRDSAVHN